MKAFLLSILSFLGLVATPTPFVPANFAATPTQILETGLPDKHLIETTFVEQAPEKKWDQPWQDACEEAALLTAHYYHQKAAPSKEKIISDLNSLFDYETSQNWTHDVSLEQMATISAKLWHYQPQILVDPDLQLLKKFLVQNIPIIVPANGKTLYRENKHFKNGGPWYHNLVILGYDDAQNQFIVHDVGTQFGAYFRYSYSLLLKSIHDFPSSLKKEEIDLGRKAVLLLK